MAAAYGFLRMLAAMRASSRGQNNVFALAKLAALARGNRREEGRDAGIQSSAICRWGARLLLALAADDADSGSTSPLSKRKRAPSR